MAKLKVLLVDDEPDFLAIVGARITSWGYEVIPASSGKEAIDTIISRHPAIVVLDYLMPEMDGVVTLREIRKIDKKIPVIMFTAYPDIKVIKDAEKLEISAFIPKLSVYVDEQSNLKSALEMITKHEK